ncbi:hypothetical protein [Spongiactinospora sp. TRM90649]|uniref:hypothetical protein n=1 Tax=Spongiactinospora sp. TRM90649 TaxID=3031114 RepID=UPI0023F9364C|nr:hypothetical protein [Spongiactinospora sp. TRM90649]MDF5755106.1 hypothetical protein [Spongiactinospora sp. TRM90649]
MHIKLPPTITQAKTGHQARAPRRHDQPDRDLKPTGRTNLSRRPTAAPRRAGY